MMRINQKWSFLMCISWWWNQPWGFLGDTFGSVWIFIGKIGENDDWVDGIGYTIFFLPGNCFCEVSFSRALSFSFPISSFSTIFVFISCSSSMFFLFLCSLLSDSLSFNLPTLSDALSFPSLISFLYLYVSIVSLSVFIFSWAFNLLCISFLKSRKITLCIGVQLFLKTAGSFGNFEATAAPVMGPPSQMMEAHRTGTPSSSTKGVSRAYCRPKPR